jgi:elongation factor P
MQLQALDLRPGTLVRYEGRMCTVTWWNILRNDRRLFVQMKLKDLESGRVTELKEHGDTKYEVLDKDEKELSHSYRDGPAEVFFTPDGEELRCPAAACEDALKWPADSYSAVFVDGNLVTINPPKHAVLTITETAPPMRNAGSGSKEATLENGVKVKVNLLCDVGDKVRIETETLEFKERVSK